MLLIIVFGGNRIAFFKALLDKLLKPELLGLHLGRELRREAIINIRFKKAIFF